MTFATLNAARSATRLTFTDAGYRRHHFVRLPDGRWCCTYGAPSSRDVITGEPIRIRNVSGNV